MTLRKDFTKYCQNRQNKENKNRVSYLLGVYSLSIKGPHVRIHSTWKMYYVMSVEIVP